jgi:hypothetical protein
MPLRHGSQNLCLVPLHSEESRSLFNRYLELLQSVSFILGLILAFWFVQEKTSETKSDQNFADGWL